MATPVSPISGRGAVPAALLLALLAAPTAAAQARPLPFERVTITLGVVGTLDRGRLDGLWRPDLGGEIALRSPFYLGQVEIGMDRTDFVARRSDLPQYTAWYVFAGWSLDQPLAGPVRWSPALRLGGYGMLFDGDDVPEHRESESELAADLISRLSLTVGRNWELSLAGGYRTVFTDPEIHLLSAAVRFGRELAMPGWLRDFLD